MKICITILLPLFFSVTHSMQNHNQYFETKFKIAELRNPNLSEAMRRNNNLALFWGGLAIISSACAGAGRLGYKPYFSVSLKAYALAIGTCGLFCVGDKKRANKYRQLLTEQAFQIPDDEAYLAQDMGWHMYKAVCES